jgi:hypothetical protein
LLRRLLGRILPRRVRRFAIECDGRILRVLGDGEPIGEIELARVAVARAWKDDLYGVDQVTLALLEREPDEGLSIDEGMEGWDAAMMALDAALPGFRSRTWFRLVAFPPGARNEMEVWRRL